MSEEYRQPFIWRQDINYGLRPSPKIKYDDIVDDTDFRHLKEQNRLTRLSQEGAGQGQGNGVFDFDESHKSSDRDFDEIPDGVIALREGRLDKADVDTLKKMSESKAVKDLESLENEKSSRKQKEISQKRQEFMDAQMGFSPESNPVNAPSSNGK